MSQKFLREAVSEVLGAVAQNPAAAPGIFGEAARRFRIMAGDPKNMEISDKLNQAASKFAEKARQKTPARFGTDFEVLLRDAVTAHENNPSGDDLDFYGRLANVQEAATDETAGDDEDEEGDDEDDDESVGGTLGIARPGQPSGPGVVSNEPTFHLKAAPPSVTGNTPLGRSAKLKINPTQQEIQQGIKPSETVILWQGNKFESQTMTVDIGILQPLPQQTTTLGTVTAYAQIEYGADGAKELVYVDVGFGTRLTVAGNYLSVLVGVKDPYNVGTVSYPPIVVSASMGFFAATSTAPVIYTEFVNQLADNAQVRLQRPFRSAVMYPPQLWPQGKCQIDFATLSQTVSRYNFDTTTANQTTAPIVLSNDTFYIGVRNTSGDGFPRAIRLIFQLAL